MSKKRLRVWATSQRLIPTRELSGLQTRIAAESVSPLRADEKWPRLWRLKRRVRVAVFLIDRLAVFYAESTPSSGSETGGGVLPAGFFARSGPATQKVIPAGKRKIL